jgi:hypothetical protein
MSLFPSCTWERICRPSAAWEQEKAQIEIKRRKKGGNIVALSPKDAEIAAEKQNREVQRRRQEALHYINKVAYYAEMEIDQAIRNGCFSKGRYCSGISSGSIIVSYWQNSFIKGDHNKYSYRVNLVFSLARQELLDILRNRYLPLGWEKLEIKSGGDDYLITLS